MAEVALPQLGESVTEGIITAWLVEVGDEVQADQPLVEISTDKVDTEIPSPVAGTVTELRAQVDDTVEVGQVIAVITETDGAPEPTATDDTGQQQTPDTSTAAPAAEPSSDEHGPGTAKALTSPLVRRLLREAGLTPEQVRGSGPGGRITRDDVRRAAEARPAGAATAPGGEAPPAGAAVPAPIVPAPAGRRRPEPSAVQIDFRGQREVVHELTRVRKAIAASMMRSVSTTAQLTAAIEVDMTPIMNLRAAHKEAFRAREGVNLTPLALVARAVCMTVPRHPVVNASIDTEAGTATYHADINLGIAVDTDRGLLVPNIKGAQDLAVPGLARRIADLAERTRSRKLAPDEVTGGTFTITNTGSVGTLFDTPILNPPEVAILATCAIEKRPVVVSDAHGDSIAIRWMSYLCMTYDHRLIDGADAARFLQDLRYVLETHDWASEV